MLGKNSSNLPSGAGLIPIWQNMAVQVSIQLQGLHGGHWHLPTAGWQQLTYKDYSVSLLQGGLHTGLCSYLLTNWGRLVNSFISTWKPPMSRPLYPLTKHRKARYAILRESVPMPCGRPSLYSGITWSCLLRATFKLDGGAGSCEKGRLFGG